MSALTDHHYLRQSIESAVKPTFQVSAEYTEDGRVVVTMTTDDAEKLMSVLDLESKVRMGELVTEDELEETRDQAREEGGSSMLSSVATDIADLIADNGWSGFPSALREWAQLSDLSWLVRTIDQAAREDS